MLRILFFFIYYFFAVMSSEVETSPCYCIETGHAPSLLFTNHYSLRHIPHTTQCEPEKLTAGVLRVDAATCAEVQVASIRSEGLRGRPVVRVRPLTAQRPRASAVPDVRTSPKLSRTGSSGNINKFISYIISTATVDTCSAKCNIQINKILTSRNPPRRRTKHSSMRHHCTP